MLCAHCIVVVGPIRPGGTQPPSVADRLRDLVCARCGGLLPEADSTDGMLKTFSTLARFGLAEVGTVLSATVRN